MHTTADPDHLGDDTRTAPEAAPPAVAQSSVGTAEEQARQLRVTLGARRDVEAMRAEAGRWRDAAAAQADVLVEEAQQVAQALILESRQRAEQLAVEAHERAEVILAGARSQAEATVREARSLLAGAGAEADRHEQARARDTSQMLVGDVEAALGRLRTDLESVAPGSTGPDPATPEPEPEPEPEPAEPGLADTFPEPVDELAEQPTRSAPEGPAEVPVGPTPEDTSSPVRESGTRPLGWLFRGQGR